MNSCQVTVCKNPLLDVSVSLWVSRRLSSLLCVCLLSRIWGRLLIASGLSSLLASICLTLHVEDVWIPAWQEHQDLSSVKRVGAKQECTPVETSLWGRGSHQPSRAFSPFSIQLKKTGSGEELRIPRGWISGLLARSWAPPQGKPQACFWELRKLTFQSRPPSVLESESPFLTPWPCPAGAERFPRQRHLNYFAPHGNPGATFTPSLKAQQGIRRLWPQLPLAS